MMPPQPNIQVQANIREDHKWSTVKKVVKEAETWVDSFSVNSEWTLLLVHHGHHHIIQILKYLLCILTPWQVWSSSWTEQRAVGICWWRVRCWQWLKSIIINASPGMLRAPLAARLGRAQQVPGQLFPLLPRRRRRRLLSRENIGRMGKEMLKRNTGKTPGRGETKSGLEKQRRSTRGETGLSRKWNRRSLAPLDGDPRIGELAQGCKAWTCDQKDFLISSVLDSHCSS